MEFLVVIIAFLVYTASSEKESSYKIRLQCDFYCLETGLEFTSPLYVGNPLREIWRWVDFFPDPLCHFSCLLKIICTTILYTTCPFLQITLSETRLMSSCVKSVTRSKKSPVVLLHCFDRSVMESSRFVLLIFYICTVSI